MTEEDIMKESMDETLENKLEEAQFGKNVDFSGEEAPYSITVQGYYRGYSVLTTVRHLNAKVKPFLQRAVAAIEWMEDNGFQPSWNPDTNKQAKSREKNDVSMSATKICPTHDVQMLSGISKKTNKPYWYHDNDAGERCFGKNYLPSRR